MQSNVPKNISEFVNYIERFGDSVAYRYPVEGGICDKSYNDLVNNSRSVASFFVNKNFSRRHIAIIGSTSYEWVCLYFGIAISDNVVIPIDKMLPVNEICNLLIMGEVQSVFVSEEFKEYKREIEKLCPDVKEIIIYPSDSFGAMLDTAHVSLPEIKENTLAELIFTSGTTGISKGVMLSHENLISNAVGTVSYDLDEIKPAVTLSVLPIHHTFELTVDNLGVLYHGATICINDKLENIVKNIQLFKPTVILIVPMMAELFYKKIKEGAKNSNGRFEFGLKICKSLKVFGIDAEKTVFSEIHNKFGGRLDTIIVGGAPLKDEVALGLEEVGFKVYQGYGLTECAPVISVNSRKRGHRLGSVGQLMPKTEVKIKDGEILVKGPSVMSGYYKNPEATEAAFDDGWLKTGDLGYMDDDGFLFITGRKKNIIILDNGKNIYPEEIEAYIGALDEVRDVMVYEDGGKICALILPHSKSDKQKIIDGIKKINLTMPTYKKVAGIYFREVDFPKTTTLKIKREQVLKELLGAKSDKGESYISPRNATEKRICLAFEQALNKSPIGIKDDFFENGGDSLAALEAASELGIPAQDIYDNPTVEALARAISIYDNENEAREIDVNSLIPLNQADEKPETRCVLLTGATGFLGSHILNELMKREVKVYCLVRSPQKLKATLKFYFPEESEGFRYEAVTGDIEQAYLGLDDGVYNKLCSEVDTVIHTAANVRHTGNYKDFELTNVIGTQNIIDFCKKADAFLHHTSTASVCGVGTVKQTKPDSSFNENILDIGQRFSQNVYIHSKYRAEEKVLLARKQGLKADIYRIGNLTWRMSDGKFQKNSEDNGFLRRCRGLIKVKAYCRELDVFPVDFTPVDSCADAYVRLVFGGGTNKIYHLLNPDVHYIKDMRKKLGCKLVSREDFEKRVRDCMPDRDVAVLSFYATIASASENIPIETDITVNKLKDLKFKWPKIKLKYLKYMRNL